MPPLTITGPRYSMPAVVKQEPKPAQDVTVSPVDRHVTELAKLARDLQDKLGCSELVTCVVERATAAILKCDFPLPEPQLRPTFLCCATATFKRGWQLKASLPVNILNMIPWMLSGEVVFVVSVLRDPNEPQEADELMTWLQNALGVWMRIKSLVVGTAPMESWHASIAKNTTLRMALALTESRQMPLHSCLTVNVDADNVLGEWFAQDLFGRLKGQGGTRCVYTWKKEDPGVTGRLCVPLDVLQACSGYDESFYATGYQDVDIKKRADAVLKSARCIKAGGYHDMFMCLIVSTCVSLVLVQGTKVAQTLSSAVQDKPHAWRNQDRRLQHPQRWPAHA